MSIGWIDREPSCYFLVIEISFFGLPLLVWEIQLETTEDENILTLSHKSSCVQGYVSTLFGAPTYDDFGGLTLLFSWTTSFGLIIDSEVSD